MKRVFLLLFFTSIAFAQTTVLWPYSQNQYSSSNYIPFGPQVDPALAQQELIRQQAAHAEDLYRQQELALRQQELQLEQDRASELNDLYARLEEQDRKISAQEQEISDLRTEQVQDAYLNRDEPKIKDPFDEEAQAEEAKSESVY